MIQVEFAGYTQLSPRIEQRASKERRATLSPLSWKRVASPSGRRQRGFDPPLRVKPRFHREKERERERIEKARLPRASLQLTINAMLVIIRSGNERVRRVAKLTNIIGPEYVLSGNKLRVQIWPIRNFITAAQLCVRKIRAAFSFRAVYFECLVMRQNLIEWDSTRSTVTEEVHWLLCDWFSNQSIRIDFRMLRWRLSTFLFRLRNADKQILNDHRRRSQQWYRSITA